ncbi:unnamed protein product [Clonostachys rhizophaga]|uniref:Uncharacterized protein n=1 Tax=Clonostachys rhizophaga TaxID=160324 RepID=A0A9N9VDC8_9HYPO|nr:unnamed protein product [Clonostachys rhizophaga]
MATAIWTISVVGLAFIAISLLCTFIMTVAGFFTLHRRGDYTRSYVSWIKAAMTLGTIWMALWIGAMLSPVMYFPRRNIYDSPRFHLYAVYQLFYLVTLAVVMATQIEVARGFKGESSGWVKGKTSKILLGVFVVLSVIRFILYEISAVTTVWVSLASYAIDLIQFILLWVGSIVSPVYLVKGKGYFNPNVNYSPLPVIYVIPADVILLQIQNSHRVYRSLLAIFILTLLRQTFECLYAIASFVSLFISTYNSYANVWTAILHIPRIIFTAWMVTATFGVFFSLASLFQHGPSRVKYDGESA